MEMGPSSLAVSIHYVQVTMVQCVPCAVVTQDTSPLAQAEGGSTDLALLAWSALYARMDPILCACGLRLFTRVQMVEPSFKLDPLLRCVFPFRRNAPGEANIAILSIPHWITEQLQQVWNGGLV